MSINTTIKKVKIKGFKLFEEEEFDFRNLTILTGENSSGKSSLIQSLLYLGNPLGLIGTSLNSDLHEYLRTLGQKELFNINGAKEIHIESDNLRQQWIKQENSLQQLIGDFQFPNNLSYPENLIYLNANKHRINQISQYIENLNNRFFGIYGDFLINYYEHNKRHLINNELIFDENYSSFTLEGQINFWLQYITNIEDLTIETEKITPTIVKNSFKIKNDEFLPENLGTGLSHLFAILVICLSATKGNIIIIENPEIHLHPKAQAKLGEFFAFIASREIQLIVETHNDHILNKVAYEIYKNNISERDVIIHYFSNPYKKETIFFNERGQFINEQNMSIQFPEGFFDATLREIFEINGY